jgi:hypothetical protein
VTPGVRRLVPAIVLVAAILVAVAYVLPSGSRNPLAETTVWSLLVVVCFAGWGSLVREAVAPRARVDLGLRVVWGAALLCALGGALIAASLMKRGAALAFVELGIVLAVAAAIRERVAVHRAAAFALRVARREPALALVCLATAGLVAVHYVAGVADPRPHPYDDDVAYLPFVRKLLDTGAFPEPFSLRRLAALGGQTLFLELVSPRAVATQCHTFDRAICVLMVVLLVVGHREGKRRVTVLVAVLAIAFFVTLQSIAINTASYYSGVAFFLGLYRTLLWTRVAGSALAPWKPALVLGLVVAATCTLRQNYLVVPVVWLGAFYAQAWLASRRDLRPVREALLVAAVSLVALAGWLVAAWQSNRTVLYPLMAGTANPAMVFATTSTDLTDELRLLLASALEGLPLHTLAFFGLAAALCKERVAGRPLWSFVVGAAAGLVALVHGLSAADPGNVGRYAVGFLGAAALAVLLRAGTQRGGGGVGEGSLGRARAFTALAVFGALAGLVEARGLLRPFYERSLRNVSLAAAAVPHSPAATPPERALYERLQHAVPEGKRVAIALDEPHWLDFSRNPIWNLDMPGYASLAPGMPFFQGSARLEEYLRGTGVRYVAFVRPAFSRYYYRREYWLKLLNDEMALWRNHAPYVIDFIDNVEDIAHRHRHVFEERGLVVVDLEEAP